MKLIHKFASIFRVEDKRQQLATSLTIHEKLVSQKLKISKKILTTGLMNI